MRPLSKLQCRILLSLLENEERASGSSGQPSHPPPATPIQALAVAVLCKELRDDGVAVSNVDRWAGSMMSMGLMSLAATSYKFKSTLDKVRRSVRRLVARGLVSEERVRAGRGRRSLTSYRLTPEGRATAELLRALEAEASRAQYLVEALERLRSRRLREGSLPYATAMEVLEELKKVLGERFDVPSELVEAVLNAEELAKELERCGVKPVKKCAPVYNLALAVKQPPTI